MSEPIKLTNDDLAKIYLALIDREELFFDAPVAKKRYSELADIFASLQKKSVDTLLQEVAA